MQTTLRFDETLMRRIKAEAAHQGISLTRYIEMALRKQLRRTRHPRPSDTVKIKLPVSRAKGGLAAGVRDLKDAFAVANDAETAKMLGDHN
jgi:hypothetical protein